LGWVSDAHVQMVMVNGVIIPLHEFKQPLRWNYRVQEDIKYEIGVVIYGITSIPNFIKFRPAILSLLNAPNRT
jgi:hypothetical protein